MGGAELAEIDGSRRDFADARVEGAGLGRVVDELLELFGRAAGLAEGGPVAEEAEEGVGARVEGPDKGPEQEGEGEEGPGDEEGVAFGRAEDQRFGDELSEDEGEACEGEDDVLTATGDEASAAIFAAPDCSGTVLGVGLQVPLDDDGQKFAAADGDGRLRLRSGGCGSSSLTAWERFEISPVSFD